METHSLGTKFRPSGVWTYEGNKKNTKMGQNVPKWVKMAQTDERVGEFGQYWPKNEHNNNHGWPKRPKVTQSGQKAAGTIPGGRGGSCAFIREEMPDPPNVRKWNVVYLFPFHADQSLCAFASCADTCTCHTCGFKQTVRLATCLKGGFPSIKAPIVSTINQMQGHFVSAFCQRNIWTDLENILFFFLLFPLSDFANWSYFWSESSCCTSYIIGCFIKISP